MTERDLKTLLQQRFQPTYPNEDTKKQPTRQRVLLESLFAQGMSLFSSFKILAQNTDSVRKVEQIGTVALADGRTLGLFNVVVTDSVKIARNRKGLRDIAAKYIDAEVANGALVFYYNDHNDRQADYRLSLIARYNEIDLETGDFIQQETRAKRYTFLLGPNESCTTAAKRLGDLVNATRPKRLKDLEEAFSVERLNRDFFKGYQWHYERFWRYVTEREPYAAVLRDDDQATKDRQEKPIRDFAKKLLGRMVFLYFLQKKGWMGCTDGFTDWQGGDPFFIRTLFERFPRPDHFYSQCLTVLYFQTLNRRRPNDRFEIDGMTPCRVPYLNGGLFDDAHERASHFDFPREFFADLLDFFEQYNFTIDENEPDEQEIGIDPEMLGHIFENLLEENRDKGTFYTPKSIVYYICREALISYLGGHFPAEADIEGFVKNQQVSAYLRQAAHANALDAQLDAVRVCDPAIGSGAFPIAMLQEIFKAKLLIYPHRRTTQPFDPAEVKLGIIENNIYGVDLDSGAVDIARLRFWLMLVVDEDAPRQLPNLDFKIMQGNSLFEEFEGVDLKAIGTEKDKEIKASQPAQLSLLGMERPTEVVVFDLATRDKLRALLRDFFDTTKTKAEKDEARQQINDEIEGRISSEFSRQKLDLRVAIEKQENEWQQLGVINNLNKRSAAYKTYQDNLTKLNSLDEKLNRLIYVQENPTEKPFFLWHLFFQDVFAEGGFDIVIGNPPYFSVSKQPALRALQTKYETYESTGDIYALFYELGYRLLRPGGTLVYITGSSWLRSNYGKSLRQFFRAKTNPIKLIDFSDSQIFESATVLTTMMAFRKEAHMGTLPALRLTRRTQRYIDHLDTHFETNHVALTNLPDTAWTVLAREGYALKQQIEAKGMKLKEWSLRINYGVKTGFNDAFVIGRSLRDSYVMQDARNGTIIKPFLRGRDIDRYVADDADLYMIFTRKGIDIDKYPLLKSHLHQFYNELRPRNNGESTGRKPGPYEWYEIQDNVAYYQDFEKPKLIYPVISKELTFAYDESGFFGNDKCFFMVGERLKYLLVYLNSRLFRYCFEEDFPELQGNSREMRKVIMEEIPVVVPLAAEEARLEILADYLLHLHNAANPPVNPYVENRQMALLFEDIANHLVCELYFGDDMREKDVALGTLLQLEPLTGLTDAAERGAIINQTYQQIQLPGSRVRQVLAEAPLECPETVGRILTTVV